MEIAFKDIKVGELYGIKSITDPSKYIGPCMSQNKSSCIFKFKMNYIWNGPQSMWNESIFYGIGFKYSRTKRTNTTKNGRKSIQYNDTNNRTSILYLIIYILLNTDPCKYIKIIF